MSNDMEKSDIPKIYGAWRIVMYVVNKQSFRAWKLKLGRVRTALWYNLSRDINNTYVSIPSLSWQ